MVVLWRLECYFVIRENGNGPSKYCEFDLRNTLYIYTRSRLVPLCMRSANRSSYPMHLITWKQNFYVRTRLSAQRSPSPHKTENTPLLQNRMHRESLWSPLPQIPGCSAEATAVSQQDEDRRRGPVPCAGVKYIARGYHVLVSTSEVAPTIYSGTVKHGCDANARTRMGQCSPGMAAHTIRLLGRPQVY